MIIEELIARFGVEVDGEAALARFQGALRKATGAITTVARAAGAVGAVVGAGSAMIAKSVFSVGAEFERYGAILETIEGSSDKARASLDWVSQFATKTPYDISQVTDAFVKLRAYGIDPMDGSLEAIGNASSAMGKDLTTGAEMLADAVNGEFERLKEFGVRATSEKNKVTLQWMQDGKTLTRTVRKNGGEIADALKDIFAIRFGGAMARQAKTWGGLTSNMGDAWTEFLRKIADAGVFEKTKARVADLLDTLGKLDQNGRLNAWAKSISDAMTGAMDAILASTGGWIKYYSFLKEKFDGLSEIQQKIIIAALGIAAAVLLAMAPVVGPILLVVAAIAAVGLALDDLFAYFEGRPSLIGKWVEWFKSLFNNIKQYIYSVFEGVKTAITEKVAGVVGALKATWGNVESFFGDAPEKIIGLFTSIDWGAVGTAIVDGILAGLQAAWGNLTAWLQAQLAELSGMFTDWLPDFGGGEPALAGAGAGAGGGSWFDGVGDLFGGVENATGTLAAGGPSSVAPSVVQNTDNSTATVNAPVTINVAGTNATPQAIGAAAGSAVKSAGTRAVSVSANEGGGGGF